MATKNRSGDENLVSAESLVEDIQKNFDTVIKASENLTSLLASTPSIWPTNGWPSSGLGWRLDPFTGKQAYHSGLDIAAAYGNPVVAPADTLEAHALLAGVEVDILSDGSLDFDDDVLGDLDWVVASIHAAQGQDRAKVTARTIAAMENPHVDAIGHPSGRLLGKRDAFPHHGGLRLRGTDRHRTGDQWFLAEAGPEGRARPPGAGSRVSPGHQHRCSRDRPTRPDALRCHHRPPRLGPGRPHHQHVEVQRARTAGVDRREVPRRARPDQHHGLHHQLWIPARHSYR